MKADNNFLSFRLFPFFLITFLLSASLTFAATYTVTNTNNGGAGSLRRAISQANNNAGLDEIHFNIPAGTYTISPTSKLPTIKDPVIIDGRTQPGFISAPIIEIDGTNAGANANGLFIRAGGSTVRGLVINRFSKYGIRIQQNGSNEIYGNFIGTDTTGTTDLGNTLDGIIIRSANNTIGGTTNSNLNLISGNDRYGIIIYGAGATDNLIQGNLIGTDINGTADLGNQNHGILVGNNASDNTIGVGSGGIGFRNRIAFNGGDGVYVVSGTGNTILSNIIYSNDGLGIDLGADGINENDNDDSDTGANDLQNFPYITSFTSGGGSSTLQGKLLSSASDIFYIQFFAEPTYDPSYHGEGRVVLGGASRNNRCNWIS